jgi:hypothetical protein
LEKKKAKIKNEILKSKMTKEDILKNAGFLKTKGKLLKALMEEKKQEREKFLT